jgi:recombination protein RecR
VSPDSEGAIARLTQELGRLPGIGPKSAERLTHHLLAADRGTVLALAEALRAIKEQVRRCSQCCNLTEGELCSICADPRRDASLICVVEQPRDLAALERTASYRGLYHVLHGRLAPLDNMGPEQLTIDRLVERVRGGRPEKGVWNSEEKFQTPFSGDRPPVQEIIMATNPTLEGDGTALFISNVLASSGVRITRLARGLPSGSVLEFANNQMLADALEGRRTF